MKLSNKFFDINVDEIPNGFLTTLEPKEEMMVLDKEKMKLLISCFQSAYEYLYE
jgi:hypothetical protein